MEDGPVLTSFSFSQSSPPPPLITMTTLIHMVAEGGGGGGESEWRMGQLEGEKPLKWGSRGSRLTGETRC